MADAARARSPRASDLPRAILFDMDDTIFDHSLTCRRSLARVREADPRLRGRPLEALWHEYLRLLEAVQPDVFAGRVTVQESRVERFRQLARFCGSEVSTSSAADLSAEYRAHYLQLRRVVPGARRVLERLQGRTVIGVVTNNEVAEQEEKLDFLKLRSLIDFMVVSAGVGVAKPDPEIFEIALRRARARPKETVMVGDSWRSDVTGARNVGIRPIWFNRFRLSPPDPWPVSELHSFRSPARAEAVLSGEPRGRLPPQ
ncbi:MAG TPA: HAD-IA family hydrolase [Thermoplasmata archaeon]|nr:HAD-IA family hydrolase [Thermoplasmata archaeon]